MTSDRSSLILKCLCAAGVTLCVSGVLVYQAGWRAMDQVGPLIAEITVNQPMFVDLCVDALLHVQTPNSVPGEFEPRVAFTVLVNGNMIQGSSVRPGEILQLDIYRFIGDECRNAQLVVNGPPSIGDVSLHEGSSHQNQRRYVRMFFRAILLVSCGILSLIAAAGGAIFRRRKTLRQRTSR